MRSLAIFDNHSAVPCGPLRYLVLPLNCDNTYNQCQCHYVNSDNRNARSKECHNAIYNTIDRFFMCTFTFYLSIQSSRNLASVWPWVDRQMPRPLSTVQATLQQKQTKYQLETVMLKWNRTNVNTPRLSLSRHSTNYVDNYILNRRKIAKYKQQHLRYGHMRIHHVTVWLRSWPIRGPEAVT